MDESTSREIEAKFTVTNADILTDFLHAPEPVSGYPADPSERETVYDDYYDTAHYDLLRRGLVLRVRTGEGVTRVTVKDLGPRTASAVHDRLELQADVDTEIDAPPYLEQTPPEMQQNVNSRNPVGKPVQSILGLEQTRTTRKVYARRPEDEDDRRSAALAELSIDEVCVLRMANDGNAGDENASRTVAAFQALELELLNGGDVAAFHRLATHLGQDHGLHPASESKLVAGLYALSTESGVGMAHDIQPQMHMAEACRLIWRRQAIEIILQEHGVRASILGDNDPEYVHDMRVAIRRARAAYELFGRYFRKRDLEPVINGLRHLGKALGKVRDLDVAEQNLAAYKESLSGTQAQISALQGITREQRAAAQQALLQWLDSDEHSALIVGFMRLATTPGLGVRRSLADAYVPQPIQVRHCMPSIIIDRFERVRAYESLLESDEAASADQLHSLRIQCKYLRYVLEFNRRLLGDEGEALIRQLKAMQDHLGELNDCAVELRRMSKLNEGVNRHADLQHRAVLQHRIEFLVARTVELRSSAPPMLRDFVQRDNRRLMGEAVANI